MSSSASSPAKMSEKEKKNPPMSSSASSPAETSEKEKKNPPTAPRENSFCCPTKSSEKELIPNFKSTDEFNRYLEKSKPTQLMVINFTTEWCAPCKKAEEHFKEFPNSYKDVKFARVDVDVGDLMKLAIELDVKNIPTFLLVKVKKEKKVKVEEEEHVKKEKKEASVLNKRYKMVKLDKVVGWNDKNKKEQLINYENKKEELKKKIEEHRYTTT